MADGISNEEGETSVSVPNSIKGLKIHWVDSHPECSVCLQPCLQPVQLPCSHIFCFLCAKGFAFRSKKCALCRRELKLEYFIDPVVVQVREMSKSSEDGLNINSYQWFYEGRNGWWQYDARTSSNIEEAFKSKIRSCEVVIAGFSYVVDFGDMIQYRKSNITRSRRVKRDRSNAARKGVAGLKVKSVPMETCSGCIKLFPRGEIDNFRCLSCTRLDYVVTDNELEHSENKIATKEAENGDASNHGDIHVET